MSHHLLKLYFSLLIFLAFGCKKDTKEPQPVAEETGTLAIKFQYKVGNQALQFNSPFVNSSNDTCKVSSFQFLLSNFSLLNKDGTTVPLPNNYLYVDASIPNDNLILRDVPLGEYVGMTYLIGVDSLTNALGAQSGALDPLKEMYWPWNGYINLILTGTSPSSNNNGSIFDYHIGGFRYPYATEQPVSHTFGTSVLNVKTNASPVVFLQVDVLELFQHPIDISIKNMANVTAPGANAHSIANNYKDMFDFLSLSN